jgi:Flp pilus assembly protein CpaB
MSVLMIRAARPSYKLWQVGVEAKISKTYSAKFDVKTTKRTVTNSEELRTLEMLTSRKYRLGKWLAENAARGLFPLQSKPDHEVAFDPKEFNQILTETVQWERREKARILAEAEVTRSKTRTK